MAVFTLDKPENRNDKPEKMYNNPKDMERARKGTSKYTDWENEPTLTELLADLEFARLENTEQRNNITGWLNLRNTTGVERPKDNGPGKSKVQPKLIRKHNEWSYPPLTEPFLNTDRMYQVLPRTEEDAPAARQNELLLNWQWDTKIDKLYFVDRAVRTFVDEGSVVVRVGWEREYATQEVEVPEYEYYPVQDEEQAAVIMHAVEMLQTEDYAYESLPDTLKASAEKSAELGEPVAAEEIGTVIEVKEVRTKNCPSVTIIDAANIFVDSSCQGDYSKSKFTVITFEATKSDMMAKKDSYINLDKVDWEDNKINSNHGNIDHKTYTPAYDSRTQSDNQPVLVYQYWGMYDTQGTGVTVPIVVTWVGNQIIQMEENPFPDRKAPFVIIPYMPILKSVWGEANASILQDNQRLIGAVTRAMIDLLAGSANAQTAYAKGFLDPTNMRRLAEGKNFEYAPGTDPRQGIMQLTFPEIPRSAHETILHQEQEAESLTGVKSFNTGISGDTFGQVATAANAAIDSAGRREMSVLRRLANGFMQIGQKIMAMNGKFLDEQEIVRVTHDNFVEVSRDQLEGNFDLKVDISTASVDEKKAQDLTFMAQTIGPNEDPNIRKIILSKIADLQRMPELAEELRNYQPEPDPLDVAMREAEVKQAQAKADLDMAKAMEARAQAEKLIQEIENNNSGESHRRDIQKMGAQARGNRDLEITKALTKGEVPPENIEAATGFNELTKLKNDQDTAPEPEPELNFNNFNPAPEQSPGLIGRPPLYP